ncbi:hypothetical protein LB505_012675 [Fusarium chuoi]|nr:hypothetical protein LB505_012675 [Fusarium chuoi]
MYSGRVAPVVMDSPYQGDASILNRLPLELLSQVVYTLPNADINNLRLTCSSLGNKSLPRFDRVFISANLRDIEVLTLIADHDRFRFQVTEIIYDDSRFRGPWDRESRATDGDTEDLTRDRYWFGRFHSSIVDAIDNNEKMYQSMPLVKEAFKTRCTESESYLVYRKLKSQQDEVIASDRDADALSYGLLRFPNLKRVTVSPAAHGILGRPLYHTPTIRSLLRGLIYPLEHGWLGSTPFEEHHLKGWDETSKREWRGFCVTTKQIARHIRENPTFNLSEFVVESRHLWTGISCRIFDNPNSDEYHDLVTIIRHPLLRRLELSVACGANSRRNWPSFRSGLLSSALVEAKNLHDLRFDTRISIVSRKLHEFSGYVQNGMPLQSMFPVKDWSNLRRFALSRSFIKQRDLMAFVSTLPSSLESLELSFLSFLPQEGTYRDLLQDMRCTLGWRERLVRDQPKLIIFVAENELKMNGVVVDLSLAAMDYVYRHGENPFVEGQIMEVLEGKGSRVDILDPAYDERW